MMRLECLLSTLEDSTRWSNNLIENVAGNWLMLLYAMEKMIALKIAGNRWNNIIYKQEIE